MEIRLKEVRESRNATQEQLAEHIGVSQVFISRVEKGTKQISLDLAAEIADYLQVSLDEIAGRSIVKAKKHTYEELMEMDPVLRMFWFMNDYGDCSPEELKEFLSSGKLCIDGKEVAEQLTERQNQRRNQMQKELVKEEQ